MERLKRICKILGKKFFILIICLLNFWKTKLKLSVNKMRGLIERKTIIKIPRSHEENKKLIEEMKEFLKKGQKLTDGEKEYVRRENEFRQKLESLQKKEKTSYKEN